jgi:hypothetical protein
MSLSRVGIVRVRCELLFSRAAGFIQLRNVLNRFGTEAPNVVGGGEGAAPDGPPRQCALRSNGSGVQRIEQDQDSDRGQ